MKDQDISGIFIFISLEHHAASLDLLVGVFVIWDTIQQRIILSILQDVRLQVLATFGYLKGKQKEMTHLV